MYTIYLVVGGEDVLGRKISSTEILVYNIDRTMKWETVGHLPYQLSGLRAVNLDNTILVFGNNSFAIHN